MSSPQPEMFRINAIIPSVFILQRLRFKQRNAMLAPTPFDRNSAPVLPKSFLLKFIQRK